jgi:hypothetical protein
MWLNALVDFVWPRLRKETELNPASVFAAYDEAVSTIEHRTPSKDDAQLLDLSAKLFDTDAARRTSIDNRASALMPAITIAVTLVTGVGFSVLKDVEKVSPVAGWSIFITYLLMLTYLTRTVFLTFRILGKVVRSTPDPTDVVPPTPIADAQPAKADPPAEVEAHTPAEVEGNPLSAFTRQYAVKLLRYTIGNYKANNVQMDALSVGQQSFRNALIVLVVGGSITAAIYMLTPLPPSYENLLL